jgi:hypothetical protein
MRPVVTVEQGTSADANRNRTCEPGVYGWSGGEEWADEVADAGNYQLCSNRCLLLSGTGSGWRIHAGLLSVQALAYTAYVLYRVWGSVELGSRASEAFRSFSRDCTDRHTVRWPGVCLRHLAHGNVGRNVRPFRYGRGDNYCDSVVSGGLGRNCAVSRVTGRGERPPYG